MKHIAILVSSLLLLPCHAAAACPQGCLQSTAAQDAIANGNYLCQQLATLATVTDIALLTNPAAGIAGMSICIGSSLIDCHLWASSSVAAIFPGVRDLDSLITDVTNKCNEVATLDCIGLGTPVVSGPLDLNPTGIEAQCQCAMSTIVRQTICQYGCPQCSCPQSPAPTPYSAGFLPITDANLCGIPPGDLGTNGCDDVCILASCCQNWSNITGMVKLPNSASVDCSTVNCGNVCRMACDRNTQSSDSACISTCGEILSNGRAYVFRRPGCCFGGVAAPFAPTHTAFGFEVFTNIFMFGSVENGAGSPYVGKNDDNGFWMTTGTQEQMFATLYQPCKSCFHGAINRSGYTDYKFYTVPKPDACAAVQTAEQLYGSGYFLVLDNCLDAVYKVLTTYGVTFPPGNAPSNILCPGSWFDALPSNTWGASTPIPSTGSPVKAEACSINSVPPSCATVVPPPSGNCPTTVGPTGPATCASLPGVQNLVDCLMQGVVKSASYQAGDLLYCTDPLGSFLCDKTTFPGAAYWCNYCNADMARTINGSCFNTWFDIPNQGYCGATVTCPNPD